MSEKQDEIDIIQLFRAFGGAFERLFGFIKKLVMTLFHFVILSILFFRKHAIKIGIAIAVGFGLGLLLEKNKDDTYVSSMVVRPNFDSTRQLYTNISYFNELRSQGGSKTDSLAKMFNLTKEQANSIKQIEIKPILEENDKITHYDNFLKELDSIPDVKLSFRNYTENIPYYIIDNHEISVYSTDRDIFSNLQSHIINSVEENEFFKRRRTLLEGNITQSDRILSGQLQDLDSLKGIYREVLLKTSSQKDRTPDGTFFNFGTDKIDLPDELKLFEEARSINDKLIDLNEQRSDLQTTTVNIISNMNPIGKRVYSKFDDKRVVFPLVFGLLAVALILLLEFNKYLNNYQKK